MFTLLSGISQELTSIKQMIENESKFFCFVCWFIIKNVSSSISH